MPLLKALLLWSLLVLGCPTQAQVAAPGQTHHMATELAADGPVTPGKTLTLALHFTPQPGWHGYWSNPGDAGYGMRLAWTLPAGWKAGEPLYPVPTQLKIAGLMNHVYESDYAVLVPVQVPAGASLATPAPIEVKADMLVCTEQICVPESATMTLRLGSQTPRDPRIEAWRAALPPQLDRTASFALDQDKVQIAVPIPASLKLSQPHVFLQTEQLVDYAAPQVFRRDGDTLVAEIPRKGLAQDAADLSGILKLDDAGNGVTFTAKPGTVPGGGSPVGGGAVSLAPLWALLGAAFLGGLVLNLMPCVFPILSLKALSLARAGESEAQAKAEGVAYTGGVLVACLALGAVLLGLRAAGSEIGWAFQLQEPGVVAFLLVLAVAITANFAGLFELPSLSLSGKGGRMGAFATGLLAAFVATPCTGPFMATAMGAALLLPWPQALLLFAALGLGLALPFLLLGFVPALRKLLPRPGKWMDTFRRVLAVPMGLTALALLWLCWRLGGAMFAWVALAVAIGLVGVLAAAHRRLAWRTAWIGAAGLALFAAIALPGTLKPVTATAERGLIAAVPFNEATLASARASGKPVFLWLTADWCLTCKVNEGVAIEREATRDAFAKAGVVAMKGDWTRRDPAITRYLTANGAAGVPLYVWYAPGKDGQVLGQVLSPDSLTQLAQGSPAKS